VEKGCVGMGVGTAANTVCSLPLASPRLTGAVGRGGEVPRLRKGNCSAAAAVEERLCTSPSGEAPREPGSPVQKLFSSLPPLQGFLLFRRGRAQTLLFSSLFLPASVLLNHNHIYQNITRISFVQDEEIQRSPQGFTR